MAPPSARRLLPGLVLSASLLSLSLCGVSAYESLTVTSPSLYPASAGLVYQKPSLFGLPNFREKIAGQVIWPEADTNPFGCAPYQAFVPADAPPGLTPTLIALIDRGNCTFSQKVLNAQNAGAQAVIVVNNEAVYGNFLPFLYAGPEGKNLQIPAMIIHGSDGTLFKQNVGAPGGLQVVLEYFVPNGDDRVEFDLYTFAGDKASATFKRQFRSVVSSLAEHVLFEPHYQTLNQYYSYQGIKSCILTGAQCTPANLDARCGNRCTNCGRYCQQDPEGNLTAGATGAEVALEQIRAKCVWFYGNTTRPAANTFWFDYVNGHDAACATPATQFDKACGDGVIASLGIPADFIAACMGTTGYAEPSLIPVADGDLAFMSTYNPLPPPQLFVNSQPYRGGLECPEPLSTTCPPFQMICQGFQAGTAPPACETSPGCVLGQRFDACSVCAGDNSTCAGCDGVPNSGKKYDACSVCLLPSDPTYIDDKSKCPPCPVGIVLDACSVCAGDNSTCAGCDGVPNSKKVYDACNSCLLRTDPTFIQDKEKCDTQVPGTTDGDSKGSSFPIGAVIGIVLGSCAMIGAAVFFYMRRQNHKMKDDIDTLLRQYLPMDSQGVASPSGRVDQRGLLVQEESDL